MSIFFGLVLGVLWVTLGLVTGWFGLTPPASYIVGFVGGLLCTSAFGPILANLSARR